MDLHRKHQPANQAHRKMPDIITFILIQTLIRYSYKRQRTSSTEDGASRAICVTLSPGRVWHTIIGDECFICAYPVFPFTVVYGIRTVYC
jgi:hypothetical protein